MDTWSEPHAKLLKAGGNLQCQQFLKDHSIDLSSASFAEKYNNDHAKLYSEILKARAAGRREPTSLQELDHCNEYNWWSQFLFWFFGTTENHYDVQGRSKSLGERLERFFTHSDVYVAAYTAVVLAWSIFWFVWKYQ
jgi:hypothetical protein